MVQGDKLNTLRINEDLCIECGVCEGICPVDAISQGENSYVIDEEACLICSQCLEACPTKAMDPVVDGKLFARA